MRSACMVAQSQALTEDHATPASTDQGDGDQSKDGGERERPLQSTAQQGLAATAVGIKTSQGTLAANGAIAGKRPEVPAERGQQRGRRSALHRVPFTRCRGQGCAGLAW